jgi:hypothetical protein
MKKIELRSLIVFGVPHELRHEVDLAAYFESLGLGAIETVVICRKWVKLREAVKKRAEALDRLERIYFDVQSSSGGLAGLAQWLHLTSAPNINTISEDVEPLLSTNGITASEEDPSLSEILSYLDAVDPRKRPTHKIFASLADIQSDAFSSNPWWFLTLKDLQRFFEKRISVYSASFWAAKYKFWDARVTALRKVPEHSPSTAVAFVTFESPMSAVCTL